MHRPPYRSIQAMSNKSRAQTLSTATDAYVITKKRPIHDQTAFVSIFPLSKNQCLSVLFISLAFAPASLMTFCRREMEEKKKWTNPPFGNWEYFGEMPITHYFDSASKPSLIQTSFFGDEGLFKAPVAMPVKPAYPYCVHCRRKVRKYNEVGVDKLYSKEHQQMKQGRVCNVMEAMPRTRRAPMAVDEDLYKIPPELLFTKPKRERALRNLLWGCMGSLNCIR